MYSFEAYIKLQNQYINKIKSIYQKTTFPNISISNQPKGVLKTTSLSCNAFFNRDGNLIHAIDLHPRSLSKYSYFFDNFNRIVKILEADKSTNIIIRENNITYTDKDNFIENIREYIGKSYENTRQIEHSFEKGIRCVKPKLVPHEEWYLYQKIYLEDYIEERFDVRNGLLDVTISELNTKSQIIKSYIMNEDEENDPNYEPIEYTLYTYFDSGLIKSESFISNEPWTKTYEYKFDDRGNWIQKITLLDDTPQFICERKLVFF